MERTNLVGKQEAHKVFSDLRQCAKTWEHAGIPSDISYGMAIAYFKEMIIMNYPEETAEYMIEIALSAMERARS